MVTESKKVKGREVKKVLRGSKIVSGSTNFGQRLKNLGNIYIQYDDDCYSHQLFVIVESAVALLQILFIFRKRTQTDSRLRSAVHRGGTKTSAKSWRVR